jgi:hypothetical protein
MNNTKLLVILAAALFYLCVGSLFTSCSKEEAEPPLPEPTEAEYTLMLYGCGGGNLDQPMHLNLTQALRSVSDKVQLTAQIKYSSNLQDEDELKGMRRFVLNDANKDSEWDEETLLDISTPLYAPETLADFITWSKKVSPAKNYILVIWNHGGGWSPSWDVPLNAGTRAVLFDDNVKNDAGNAIPMSINQLVAGITQSGVHFKMLYYDACLMGMLENLSELGGVADYALASVHSVPGIGGDYGSLMEHLTKSSSFTDAITHYCTDVMELWDLTAGDSFCDIGMTDLSMLPAVNDVLRRVTDELVATYTQQKDAYNTASQQAYSTLDSDDWRVSISNPFIDVVDYVQLLAEKSNTPNMVKLAAEMDEVANEALVCRNSSGVVDELQMSWGVTLTNAWLWATLEYEKAAYTSTAFDKASGWSRWLQLNEKLPISFLPTADDGTVKDKSPDFEITPDHHDD